MQTLYQGSKWFFYHMKNVADLSLTCKVVFFFWNKKDKLKTNSNGERQIQVKLFLVVKHFSFFCPPCMQESKPNGQFKKKKKRES